MMIKPLNCLQPGETGQVQRVCCAGALSRRLLELGIAENTPVRCLYRGPCGSPIAFCACGTVIALRATDAAEITVAVS